MKTQQRQHLHGLVNNVLDFKSGDPSNLLPKLEGHALGALKNMSKRFVNSHFRSYIKKVTFDSIFRGFTYQKATLPKTNKIGTLPKQNIRSAWNFRQLNLWSTYRSAILSRSSWVTRGTLQKCQKSMQKTTWLLPLHFNDKLCTGNAKILKTELLIFRLLLVK